MDMSALKPVWFLLVFSLPLFAQEHRLHEHQLGAYKGSEGTVRSVMDYCDAVDESVQEQQPRIFAELNIDSTTRAKSRRWKELANKDEWEQPANRFPLHSGGIETTQLFE
jgi:hypothetical protein